MRLQKIVLYLLLMATVLSCQKEVSVENGIVPTPNPATTNTDSNYLYKLYSIDSTVLYGADSVIRTYFYDNQKRVVLITDSTNESYSGGPDRWLYTKLEYFYTGNDSLPYKTNELRHEYGNTVESYERWHYFNNATTKIKDSIIFSYNTTSSITLSLYSYSGSTIYGYSTHTEGGVIKKKIYDTATLNTNGCITFNIKHHKDPLTSVTMDTVRSYFTYDNKHSPYGRLSNFKTYQVFPHGETFTTEFVQKNNIMHTLEKTTGTSHYLYDSGDLTGKYIYNNAGYPVLMKNYDLLNPPNVFIEKYVYKAL